MKCKFVQVYVQIISKLIIFRNMSVLKIQLSMYKPMHNLST